MVTLPHETHNQKNEAVLANVTHRLFALRIILHINIIERKAKIVLS